MIGFPGIALAVSITVLSNYCDDAKAIPADAKVLSKTAAGIKYGEVVKITADSVTIKEQEVVPSGKKATVKTKEHTYPIDEKTKVKYTKATKDAVPKVDEIAVGEKITMHMTSFKTKDSDNKIDNTLVVTGIDLTPKPPKKDDKPSTDKSTADK